MPRNELIEVFNPMEISLSIGELLTDSVSDDDGMLRLRGVLRGLSERDLSVLYLRSCGYTMRGIGAYLGLSMSAVRWSWRRSLRTIGERGLYVE